MSGPQTCSVAPTRACSVRHRASVASAARLVHIHGRGRNTMDPTSSSIASVLISRSIGPSSARASTTSEAIVSRMFLSRSAVLPARRCSCWVRSGNGVSSRSRRQWTPRTAQGLVIWASGAHIARATPPIWMPISDSVSVAVCAQWPFGPP